MALKYFRKTLAFVFLLFALSCDKGSDEEVYPNDYIEKAIINSWSEENNFTEDRIGGGFKGFPYSDIIHNGTYNVSTRGELLNALHIAKQGEVIYVKGRARIDLSGLRNLRIPDGVILASDRGHNGSEGAVLYTQDLNTKPLFLIEGSKVRITGLRIFGPDNQHRSSAYELPNSRGIQCSGASDVEIDNCEIASWSHAGIALFDQSFDISIHHNYIHHCRRTGLGYGVVHDGSKSSIVANLFDFNKHSIAGTGIPGTSYSAVLNVCLKNETYTHSFDMHGCGEAKNCPSGKKWVAGDEIYVKYNTFYSKDFVAINIRGNPDSGVWVNENWFLHDSPEKALILGDLNKFVSNNYFGPERRFVE
ncbi:right-handed parallel beta-helix repeat-containing protein [Fulvivirgaceae bacterium BMA10]|uniref:Right-handed parallel beta-helix repeat-containing protein n=1 Tax=Splendidivirga corallicola TaxID=3051826 RepID=A0ABT8KLP2_9BACT|nr:right-handed parallel beta-helix repeat-containing protein [Fulvivirgaceae bacterium BMA10]